MVRNLYELSKINMNLSNTILKDAAECFTLARTNVVEGMSLLYQIHKDELWKDQYSSFSEYVEQECQLSKSYASKLLQVWEGYVIEGKVSPRNLGETDAERLYLVLRLPGTIESKLIKAQTWNREDIISETRELKAGIHNHQWQEIHLRQCTKCGLKEHI